MARKPKSDGETIRNITKGIELDHDTLIAEIEARSREEYQRASDAGESAAKVTAYLEKTSLNGQAFSWLKSIMKKLPKKDGSVKALDVISSLEAGLPLLRAHIEGQSPALPFGDPEPAANPGMSDDEISEGLAQFDPVEEFDPVEAASDEPFDLAAEADDFEAALAQAAE